MVTSESMAVSSSSSSKNCRSASGLQMIKNMKLWAVTMLAVVTASACGVGVDETYEGVTLVSSSSSALQQEETTPTVGAEPAAVPNVPQTPVTTTPSPIRDPGAVALPQDPIPVFEGKPMGTPPPPGFTEPPVPGPRR